jgi:hypothetical protein
MSACVNVSAPFPPQLLNLQKDFRKAWYKYHATGGQPMFILCNSYQHDGHATLYVTLTLAPFNMAP